MGPAPAFRVPSIGVPAHRVGALAIASRRSISLLAARPVLCLDGQRGLRRGLRAARFGRDPRRQRH
jgi:hypothetical protein